MIDYRRSRKAYRVGKNLINDNYMKNLFTFLTVCLAFSFLKAQTYNVELEPVEMEYSGTQDYPNDCGATDSEKYPDPSFGFPIDFSSGWTQPFLQNTSKWQKTNPYNNGGWYLWNIDILNKLSNSISISCNSYEKDDCNYTIQNEDDSYSQIKDEDIDDYLYTATSQSYTFTNQAPCGWSTQSFTFANSSPSYWYKLTFKVKWYYASIVGGTISGNQCINTGTTPSVLTSQNTQLPFIFYQWEYNNTSTNGIWQNVPSNGTGVNYSPSAILGTTSYRRKCYATDCNNGQLIAYSNTITISVVAPGTISANSCVAYGGTLILNNLTNGHSNNAADYTWEYSNSSTNSTWVTLPNATGLSYSVPNIQLVTSFRRKMTGCNGNPIYSNIVSVNIIPTNDNCANATAINVSSNPVSFSTICATVDGANMVCGNPATNNKNAWFAFTPNATTYYHITLLSASTGFTPTLALYSGTCNSLQEEAACANVLTFLGNAGQAYYISAGNLAGAEGSGSFILSSALQGGSIIVPTNAILSFCGSGDPAVLSNQILATNGAFYVTPQGTIGISYSYQWQSSIDNGTTWIDIQGASNAYSYDPPMLTQTTLFRRKVTDNTSGSIAYSNTINVEVKFLPVVTITDITNNCIGGQNSSSGFRVNVANRQPAYQVQLSTGGGYQNFPNNAFRHAGAGTYQVTVKDGNSCVSTSQTITILNASSPPPINYNFSAPICGTATLTTSPSNASYQWSLDGGAFQNSNVFNNVTFSPHYIVAQNSAGCTRYRVLDYNNSNKPRFYIQVKKPSSSSAPNNVYRIVIDLFNTSGSQFPTPFTYQLDNGTFQTSNIFYNPSFGSHTVSIKASNSCIITKTVVVAPVVEGCLPNAFAINVLQPVSCNGGTTSIRIDKVINGLFGDNNTTYSSPNSNPFNISSYPILSNQISYMYKMDNGAFQTSPMFNNVGAGIHSFVIQRVTQAWVNESITINIPQPPAIPFTASFNPITCSTCPTDVVVNSSANITSYQLDNGTPQVGNTFVGVMAGNHTITVTTASGCATQNITINAPNIRLAQAENDSTEIQPENTLEQEVEVLETIPVVENSINIYPNPTQNELNIQIQNGIEGENIELVLYDMQGKEVMRKSWVITSSENEHQTLDLSVLSPQVYNLVVIEGKKVHTFKVVKTE